MNACSWLAALLWVTSASMALAQEANGERGAVAAQVTEATLDQEWISLDGEVELARLERAAPLRAIDKQALQVNERWKDGSDAPAPVQGDDGRIVLVYGTTRPKLVCAPLRVCMIQLQAGESVTDLQAGDTARWKVELSMSGAITYVVVKPRRADIETDLAIVTDKRAYTFTLSAHATEHMSIVSFEYPDEQREQWRKQIAAQARRQLEQPSVPGPAPSEEVIRIDPKKLHTKYEIEIDHPWFCRRKRNCVDWAPVEVLDDGRRTWIRMPDSVGSRTLPVLFVKTQEGWEQVAFRFKRETMTFYVDRVFSVAELVLGINGSEGTVTLVRRERG